MDEQERERLEQLLRSVEKEELEESRAADGERERLRRMLFDSENQLENGNLEEDAIEREGSEQSEDEVEVSDHNSDSEISLEDVSDVEVLERMNETNNIPENYILGKDGETKWCPHMNDRNIRGRIRRHNIIRAERIGVRLPCPRGEAKSVKTPLEAWKLFFPDELIEKIAEYTHIWIDKNRHTVCTSEKGMPNQPTL